MKIGILTFHNADNCGAVLQCYALQKFLQNMGQDVDVIDYRNSYIEELYSTNFNIIKLVKQIYKYGPFYCLSGKENRRKLKFNDFRERFLKLSPRCKTIPCNYDAYIIGSDQMWSVGCTGKVDNVYFGNFNRPYNTKLIGYAISSSCDFVQYLSIAEVKDCFSKFNAISFRETKVSDLINCITNVCAPVTIDPTLLLDSKDWDNMLDNQWENRNYVVTYQVRRPSRPNSNRIDIIARNYANQFNYEVVELYGNDWGPIDFVSAIKYAKCVFSSSFHATVFSVIFGTPFYSFVLHDGSDYRYVNLLKSLDLIDHLKQLEDDINECLPIDIDKRDVALDNLRKFSIDFLEKCFV